MLISSEEYYGNQFRPDLLDEVISMKNWYTGGKFCDDDYNIHVFAECELNKLFNDVEYYVVDIDNLICTQNCLQYHIVNKPNFENNSTPICLFKIHNSDRYIIHDGHHRIAYLMKNGIKTVSAKVLEIGGEWFKDLQ